jgi:hypothetical protein
VVVIFYKTTGKGSKEVARVTISQGGDLEGPPAYVNLLLKGQRGATDAMRDAPRRFNGAYLRAEFRP